MFVTDVSRVPPDDSIESNDYREQAPPRRPGLALPGAERLSTGAWGPGNPR